MNRSILIGGGIAVVVAILAWGILPYRSPEPAPAAASSTVPETTAPAAVPTSTTSAPTAAQPAPIGTFALVPGGDFTAVAPVDGKGAAVDMTPYRGKVLLVNLWA